MCEGGTGSTGFFTSCQKASFNGLFFLFGHGDECFCIVPQVADDAAIAVLNKKLVREIVVLWPGIFQVDYLPFLTGISREDKTTRLQK